MAEGGVRLAPLGRGQRDECLLLADERGGRAAPTPPDGARPEQDQV